MSSYIKALEEFALLNSYVDAKSTADPAHLTFDWRRTRTWKSWTEMQRVEQA